MTRTLLTPESIEAYKQRFLEMTRLGFSSEGDEKFVTRFSVTSEQRENLHVQARLNGWTVSNDEPRSLGGGNAAPTPMELFLASLANCLEISALLYFSFSKLRVESVRVTVDAWFDKRHVLPGDGVPPPGFQDISWSWHVVSGEAREKIERVLEKVDANCPVKGTIDNRRVAGHALTLETP